MNDFLIVALYTTPLILSAYFIAGKMMPEETEANLLWTTQRDLLAKFIAFVVVMIAIGISLLLQPR